MKTIEDYKSEYASARNRRHRKSIFNKAILNLQYYEQQQFIKWQIIEMNKSN